MPSKIEPTASEMTSNYSTQDQKHSCVEKQGNNRVPEDAVVSSAKTSVKSLSKSQKTSYLYDVIRRIAPIKESIRRISGGKKSGWDPDMSRRCAENIKKYDPRFNESKKEDLELMFFDVNGEIHDPVIISKLKEDRRKGLWLEKNEGSS